MKFRDKYLNSFVCEFSRVVFVKFGDFESQLAFSALAVALIVLLDSQGRITPLFALALFALSQAGYAALAALRKGGMESPDSEFLFIIVAIAGFIACSISFFAFSSILPLLFVPFALCAGALGTLARGYLTAG